MANIANFYGKHNKYSIANKQGETSILLSVLQIHDSLPKFVYEL